MDEKEFSDDENSLRFTMEADSKLDNLKLEVKPIDNLSESDDQFDNSKPNLTPHGSEDKTDVAMAQSTPFNEEVQFNTSFKKAKEVYHYFWEAKEVFSQWFPSRFTVDGKKFCCAEQYMMYTKAILLHNDDLAEKIMKCDNPSKIKSYGRKVKEFNDDLWLNNCLHVVKEGNRAKFVQNADMKELLLSTYPKILVEASPYDKIWGIGLKKYQEGAWNEVTWEGYNLLGYILTELRDELLCESGFIKPNEKKVYFDMLTKKLQDWLKNSASEEFQVEKPCKNKNKGDGRKHYPRDEKHQLHHSDNAAGFSEETPSSRSPNAQMEDDRSGKSEKILKDTDEEFQALALGNVSEKVQNVDNNIEGTPSSRSPNAQMEDDRSGKSEKILKDTDEEFQAAALGNVSEKVQNVDNNIEGHDKDTCEYDERSISNSTAGVEALNQF